MSFNLKGSDLLYLGLGAGALFLILRNAKPLSASVEGATSVINPLLNAAGKGAAIVTNPSSYDFSNYTVDLLKAPFTKKQAWDLYKQQPGFSTWINAVGTSWGVLA